MGSAFQTAAVTCATAVDIADLLDLLDLLATWNYHDAEFNQS